MSSYIEVHAKYGTKGRVLLKKDDIRAVMESGDSGKYKDATYIAYGEPEDCTVIVSESFDEVKELLEDV